MKKSAIAKKPTIEEIRRVDKLIYRGAESIEAARDCARIEELFDDLETLLTSWIVNDPTEEVTEAVLLKWYEMRNELTVQISDLIKRTGVDDGAFARRGTDPARVMLKFIRSIAKKGVPKERLKGYMIAWFEHNFDDAYSRESAEKLIQVFLENGSIYDDGTGNLFPVSEHPDSVAHDYREPSK